MIVVSGSIELDVAHEDEFLASVETLVDATVAEPGCRSYSFWRDLRRPGVFHVFEEWDDDEALAAHIAAGPYRAFARAMAGFGVTAVSVDRYDVTTKAALREAAAMTAIAVDDFPPGVELNETLAMIGQARAMRRLKADAVPQPLVDALIWAGTRAASPNNTQLWSFVVVTDADVRRAIGDALARFAGWVDSLGRPADASDAYIRQEARHLIVNIGSAPVLIFVCAEHSYPTRGPDVRYLWSATNTASQNIVVAARSLGLGATLTMMQVGNHDGVREILGLPPEVEIGALIPVGWPDRPFGPVRRRALDEVVHHDRW